MVHIEEKEERKMTFEYYSFWTGFFAGTIAAALLCAIILVVLVRLDMAESEREERGEDE